jgi:hypothetical protein
MPNIRNGNLELQNFSALMELVPREENLLERMGVFDVEFSDKTVHQFERILAGTDTMYSVARGADRGVAGDDSAKSAFVEVPFFALDKVTKSNEVQDMRQFGTADVSETVQNRVKRIIDRIQRGHARLHTNVMYSCLNGTTYAKDAAGADRTSLVKAYQAMFEVPDTDMFKGTAGGVGTVDLTDIAANPADYFETFRQHVIAQAGDGGDDYEIIALLGSGAFTALKNHPDYVEAFSQYASSVDPLRNRLGGLKNNRVLEWQGVTYVEDISGKIGNDQIRMFPKGMDMFKLVYAPADTEEHANTVAEASYLFLDSQRRKTIIESETSVVAVNTRPELVARITATI